MRVFYDTEFLEDGKTIELISIGMVREDGEEYYAVNSNMPVKRIRNHTWLMRNVIPALPQYSGDARNVMPKSDLFNSTDPLVKDRKTIAREVSDFLHLSKVELWAYYASYDHVALAQLFGFMVSLPRHIPMRTKDLACLIDTHDAWEFMPKQVGISHHALDDARHVRDCYEFLMRRDQEK